MSFQKNYTFDKNLLFKDAGVIAASAAAQVAAVDKIIDTGGGPSLWEAEMVVDVSAIEVATDEHYEIEFQVSNSATFASVYHAQVTLNLGHASVIGGDTDTPAGRYVFGVSNYFGGTVYRYVRLFTRIAGTIATGINYTAYAVPRI